MALKEVLNGNMPSKADHLVKMMQIKNENKNVAYILIILKCFGRLMHLKEKIR